MTSTLLAFCDNAGGVISLAMILAVFAFLLWLVSRRIYPTEKAVPPKSAPCEACGRKVDVTGDVVATLCDRCWKRGWRLGGPAGVVPGRREPLR